MNAVTRFHPDQSIETLRVDQSLSYNWEYDTTRARLMRLYENAKRDQWDGATRLDWSIDVDPEKGPAPPVRARRSAANAIRTGCAAAMPRACRWR